MTPVEDLQWHWGGAYAIWRSGEVYWYAQNRDTRKVLKAASHDRLRQLIRDDRRESRLASASPSQ